MADFILAVSFVAYEWFEFIGVINLYRYGNKPAEQCMIEIKEWVTPVVVGAYPDETVLAVVKRMRQHGIGSVIVNNMERKPLGIFTERDLLNKVIACDKDPKTTTIKEVMTSPIETVDINRPVLEVFRIFAERDFRHLPVSLEDVRIVGVLSLRSKTFIQEICRIME